jgi:hypothetical protein
MRVRVPSRRGDPAYFAAVEETLRSLKGVERVEADPLTGGVLILHGIDPGAIVEYAAQKALFLAREEEAKKAGGTVLHDVLSAPFGSFSRRIRGFTGNAADLSGLAVLALLTVGVYQIARGNFGAPAWYTAFWYALGIFNKSDGGRKQEPEGGKTNG